MGSAAYVNTEAVLTKLNNKPKDIKGRFMLYLDKMQFLPMHQSAPMEEEEEEDHAYVWHIDDLTQFTVSRADKEDVFIKLCLTPQESIIIQLVGHDAKELREKLKAAFKHHFQLVGKGADLQELKAILETSVPQKEAAMIRKVLDHPSAIPYHEQLVGQGILDEEQFWNAPFVKDLLKTQEKELAAAANESTFKGSHHTRSSSFSGSFQTGLESSSYIDLLKDLAAPACTSNPNAAVSAAGSTGKNRTITLTAAKIEGFFKMFPKLKEIYHQNVPLKMSEEKFWSGFVASFTANYNLAAKGPVDSQTNTEVDKIDPTKPGSLPQGAGLREKALRRILKETNPAKRSLSHDNEGAGDLDGLDKLVKDSYMDYTRALIGKEKKNSIYHLDDYIPTYESKHPEALKNQLLIKNINYYSSKTLGLDSLEPTKQVEILLPDLVKDSRTTSIGLQLSKETHLAHAGHQISDETAFHSTPSAKSTSGHTEHNETKMHADTEKRAMVSHVFDQLEAWSPMQTFEIQQDQITRASLAHYTETQIEAKKHHEAQRAQKTLKREQQAASTSTPSVQLKHLASARKSDLSTHETLSELLKHYWLSFPISSESQYAKVIDIVKVLQRMVSQPQASLTKYQRSSIAHVLQDFARVTSRSEKIVYN